MVWAVTQANAKNSVWLKKVSNFLPVCGIEQNNSLSLLGVTLQNDCKFSSHVKGKLREENKYLYILRSLRKDGYT